ncbi:MAG: NADP-dependent malic enzyme [Owenweeksia sp. TMED14]|nr:MAG: NADP-dependent malic enzyme [Owenweeksia sp. TMED14]|tara:strand:+ start:2253 stop:4538 length:2286 start_codon:yes stop_codon:yes gene_type:complete
MSKKSSLIRKKDILDYHEGQRPGKIEVVPTKPSNSQRDLSIAYSPGVAEPCLKIAENADDAYRYTAKGNLVAVISNGTAVLGLGNIGPLASKPVMEGKGVLFKIFADIDVFDLELDTTDTDKFIETVKILSPTFGGINLEDISAPECFEIEKRLREELNIPIMHDDQHGTAIITGAALLNAIEIVGKDINNIKVVFNGAGASAISCASLYLALGVLQENMFMCDSKGVIHANREGLTHEKLKFARKTELRNLDEALRNADVFVGLSKGNVLSPEMIKSMAKDAIVFALANPDPEISYQLAKSAREDIIMATGRSDNPNQVNNVLGFPYIFRGALDVRATQINEEMKLAAVYSIAQLAKEPVPEIVNLAYGSRNLTFGSDYIIPKPFDPRLIYTVAPAVARAAMDSGVAKSSISNWDAYEEDLKNRLGHDDKFIRLAMEKAQSSPKRVVFNEAANYKILKAAQIVRDEGIAIPVLLGNTKKIEALNDEYSLGLEELEIIDTKSVDVPRLEEYIESYYKSRQRKGVGYNEARRLLLNRDYYGPMMVKMGDADAYITGAMVKYPRAVKPVIEILGPKDNTRTVAGVYVMLTKKGPKFFTDTTMNQDPSAERIAQIACETAELVRKMNIEPRIALLSYSNFGSSTGKTAIKMRDAISLIRKSDPSLIVDGEMQANFAVDNKLLKEQFPFSDLVGKGANIFVFPGLSSANISYKLLQSMGGVEAVGPLLVGLRYPAHVLQLGSSVREIVNTVAMAVIDAQSREGIE